MATMAAARFETLTPHVDWFTPDERTDRPALGAVHGTEGTLPVEGGASVAHLSEFLAELERLNRPPIVAIALTHWHWDHSFGSAAVAVPVIAQRETARELELQAGYDFSDEALDQRVEDGLELDFCRDMMKLEIPDRNELEIVLPTVVIDQTHTVDLGGVTAVIDHVGGDHAPDSCVIYVPEDGVRNLTARLDAYDVEVAIEGHGEEATDAEGFAARLDELRAAADLVEAYGTDAAEHAGGDAELVELAELVIAGQRLQTER